MRRMKVLAAVGEVENLLFWDHRRSRSHHLESE